MKTNWLTEIVKEKFAATNDDLNFSQLTPFIFRKMLEAGITSKSKAATLVEVFNKISQENKEISKVYHGEITKNLVKKELKRLSQTQNIIELKMGSRTKFSNVKFLTKDDLQNYYIDLPRLT